MIGDLARQFRLLLIAASVLASAAVSAAAWWTPDREQYPYQGVYSPHDTPRGHAVWIQGTTVRDRDRMAEIAELFPPYTFDSPREYMPGIGDESLFGHLILVDGGRVTFIVTENRATELSGSRMLTYVLLCELVRLWTEHSGHDSVVVSLAYVPVFKQPVTFAYGHTTAVGVKVVMST